MVYGAQAENYIHRDIQYVHVPASFPGHSQFFNGAPESHGDEAIHVRVRRQLACSTFTLTTQEISLPISILTIASKAHKLPSDAIFTDLAG